MKAYVGEISSQFFRPWHLAPVVNTKRNIVLLQQLKDRGRVPALVAKLDGELVAFWQDAQEICQTLKIQLPSRWQLKQHRSKRRPQWLCAREQELDRISGILQALDVRDEAAGFHREYEAGRRQFSPSLKRLFLWQTVKAVVDFDRMKFARVPGEHFVRRMTLGIEISQPVFVMPAGGADMHHGIQRSAISRTDDAENDDHLRDRERSDWRVRAALRAALDRLARDLRRAADLACRESARCDAPDRPSLFKARFVARERFAEGRLRRVARWLRLSFCAEAVPFGAGGSFTPAFLAFERPMAIACFGFLTPCFPSRT